MFRVEIALTKYQVSSDKGTTDSGSIAERVVIWRHVPHQHRILHFSHPQQERSMGDKEEQESETTQALADSAPDMASVFPSSSANKVTSAQEDLPLFRDEPGTGKKAKRRRTRSVPLETNIVPTHRLILPLAPKIMAS